MYAIPVSDVCPYFCPTSAFFCIYFALNCASVTGLLIINNLTKKPESELRPPLWKLYRLNTMKVPTHLGGK